MFNLQHASKALIDRSYRNAIKLYETALNEIEKAKVHCVFVRLCVCLSVSVSPLPPLMSCIEYKKIEQNLYFIV